MPVFQSSSLTLRASRRVARYLPTHPRLLTRRQPLVSFTFDDVPDSACTQGAGLIEEQGHRGTFYIAPGICGQVEARWRAATREQVADLPRRGHEIDCHTYSHLPVQQLSARALAEDDDRCRAALHEICDGIALRSFAYPFGIAGLARKLQMQGRYESCRGIHVGTDRGLIDLGLLRVRELYDSSTSAAGVDTLLDDLQRRGGWLIFYSHDVAQTPSPIGCSPGLLEYALRAVTNRGIACMTVGDAVSAKSRS